MDKRIRNAAIASVVVAMLLILSSVMLLNVLQNPEKTDSKPASEIASSEEKELADEKIFLDEPNFLDEYQPFAGEEREDDRTKLSLLVSSVERDLRVMVIDENGDAVQGETFYVTVEGIGDYKDLDADGFIYIGGIKPGSYYVSLKETGDYQMPDKVKVSVKDKIEFVKLDDISYLIKTEDEIDAEVEDTANHQVDADESEHTEAWDNRQDAVLGIDVSKWNKTIDWDKVKESGVRFVIIRCGYRVFW